MPNTFENRLRRIHRRIAMEEVVTKHEGQITSLSDLRAVLAPHRQRIKNIDSEIKQFGSDLVRNPYNIDSETLALITTLTNMIEHSIPDRNIALIPLGSRVGGGKKNRDFFNIQVYTSDLDLGVIGDNLDEATIEKITTLIQSYLQCTDIFLCREINPEKYFFNNLQTVQDGIDALDTLLDENTTGTAKKLLVAKFLMLLMPSSPESVNETNTEIIFNALRQISVDDQKKWESLVRMLFKAHKNEHVLKDKHFQRSYFKPKNGKEPLTNKLIDSVANQSADAMSKPFQDWLIATHHTQNTASEPSETKKKILVQKTNIETPLSDDGLPKEIEPLTYIRFNESGIATVSVSSTEANSKPTHFLNSVPSIDEIKAEELIGNRIHTTTEVLTELLLHYHSVKNNFHGVLAFYEMAKTVSIKEIVQLISYMRDVIQRAYEYSALLQQDINTYLETQNRSEIGNIEKHPVRVSDIQNITKKFESMSEIGESIPDLLYLELCQIKIESALKKVSKKLAKNGIIEIDSILGKTVNVLAYLLQLEEDNANLIQALEEKNIDSNQMVA